MEISNAEYEVLEVIWHKSPCTSSEIIERLKSHKDWHEKTVKTLLSRLVKKQALGFKKDKRRYLYFPLIEKADYQQKESAHLLDKLFGGKVSPFLAAFAGQKKLQEDDIQQLKKLIADWEKQDD